MPEFWEFPTVSMGLGPINAIYQARFNRYLHARGIADTSQKRVWAFLGDGECDEPEALGALTLAARDGLDNLTFVVNCNLQRLDGPVRGNGKIIQELEAVFRGAGWNVIKVIWGRQWDPLLARDRHGVLEQKMMDTLDGDYQLYSVEDGAFVRKHFFGPDPELARIVEDISDDDIKRLRRGGHDYRKMYAAYKMATESVGQPTVILAKTVKGWTLGAGVAGRNVTHQKKKLEDDQLRTFRDLLELPIPDDQLDELPFHHPGPKSDEVRYLIERRRALGGFVPTRRRQATTPIAPPADAAFAEFLEGTKAGVEASTTMAYVRMLRKLMKDQALGRRVVPIIPDEARTFGMDPLFAEFGIYASQGQKYTPVDADYVMKYHEAADGQILQEGITEAGALCDFTAASTSYSTHGEPTVPFYMFYSMFGFQRVADLIWACADQRGRGFLLGATAGRTTLMGEGLQHNDGQSHVMASLVPSVHAYDPAYAFEAAIITREGLRRMLDENDDVIYYLTLYNEAYAMPAMPEGASDGVLKGLYRFREAPKGKHRVRLLGSGPMLNEVLRAADMLAEDHDVAAEVWSATSYSELRRDGLEVDRWNRLHPGSPARKPYVTECLGDEDAPIVCASDYMKTMPDMIAKWVPSNFTALGTDGFGRSDTRQALRRFFEIDAAHIVVAALSGLCRAGAVKESVVARAMKALEIDPDTDAPESRDLGPRKVEKTNGARKSKSRRKTPSR